MQWTPKSPPRFVPTLTDVVREDPAGRLQQEPGVRPEAIPALGMQPQTQAALPSSAQATPPPVTQPSAPTLNHGLPPDLEEHLVHRVMQRVDLVLDMRLRDAIATVVQEQTRSMLPRLREEVESVVRQSVYEAVADELAADPTRPLGR
jgi:hypothetical protein